MSKYKLVVFDFDGTLADSFPFFLECSIILAEKHKFTKFGKDDVDELRKLHAREMIKHLNLPLWKLFFVARDFRKFMKESINQIKMFDGISEVFQNLHKHGIEIAVLTSNSKENVVKVLGEDNSKLIKYFECDVSVFGKKPRFKRIIKQSKYHPSQILSIGDEMRDIDAAKSTGVSAGAVAWGYTNITSLINHEPHEVFLKVEDLNRIAEYENKNLLHSV